MDVAVAPPGVCRLKVEQDRSPAGIPPLARSLVPR